MIGSRCQLQLPHSRLHQRLAGFIQNTIFADLCWVHVSVAGNIRALKAFSLVFATSFNQGRISIEEEQILGRARDPEVYKRANMKFIFRNISHKMIS